MAIFASYKACRQGVAHHTVAHGLELSVPKAGPSGILRLTAVFLIRQMSHAVFTYMRFLFAAMGDCSEESVGVAGLLGAGSSGLYLLSIFLVLMAACKKETE